MELYKNKYITINAPAIVTRALEIAVKCKKGVLWLNSDSFTTVDYLFCRKPCPCGYFGSQLKSCTCTPDEIEKHRNSFLSGLNDALWVVCDLSWRWYKFNNIDESALMLLKQACVELGLNARAVVKTVEIAAAIADNEEIEVEHIAEALSYRVQ